MRYRAGKICGRCKKYVSPNHNCAPDRVGGDGPMVIVPNMEGYNPGLGCMQRNVKDRLKELRDGKEYKVKMTNGEERVHHVNGVELHETGNERIEPKPRRKEY